MLPIRLSIADAAKPTILCLGAHSDDIEIGAGATILALAESCPRARIVWTAFAGHGSREGEARASAEFFTAGFAKAEISIHAIRDGYFPQQTGDIKPLFELLKKNVSPDLVLTHFRDDRHQDHRAISDLTWQTFRDQLILEYEIPKFDGDFGTPNFFWPVSDALRAKKTDALERFFKTQSGKGWFTRETFDAVMRLRGMECNSPSGYAEAFYCRKAVMDAAGG